MVPEGCSLPLRPGFRGTFRLDTLPSPPQAAFSREGRWRPLGSDHPQDGEVVPTAPILTRKAPCCPSGSSRPGLLSRLCCSLAGASPRSFPALGLILFRRGVPGSGPRPRVSQHSLTLIATLKTRLFLLCRTYFPATISPPSAVSSLNTPPPPLRLASQLPLSLSTPSPGIMRGDLQIHIEGPLNRPASWPGASSSPRRPPPAPSGAHTLAHSQLPLPAVPFLLVYKASGFTPWPSPACVPDHPNHSHGCPNSPCGEQGLRCPFPSIQPFPPHQNTLPMVPT